MNIATLIARILLGLLFTFAGAMAFVMGSPPPQPGLAGTFDHAYFASHYSLFVAAAQLIIGVLLLANRYVPIALIMLAAFLYNSFAYHITMAPSALFAPVAVLALWTLIALKYRSALLLLVRT
jgi:uncharacterized membrane protein YphA (DoxX/SURF4 family)